MLQLGNQKVVGVERGILGSSGLLRIVHRSCEGLQSITTKVSASQHSDEAALVLN